MVLYRKRYRFPKGIGHYPDSRIFTHGALTTDMKSVDLFVSPSICLHVLHLPARVPGEERRVGVTSERCVPMGSRACL